MKNFIGFKSDFYYIILYLALFYLTHGKDQTEITEITGLYDNVKNCNEIQDEKVKFSYEIDADYGTVSATFHLPKSCNHTKFEIDLQVFEGIENESCIGNLCNEGMFSKRFWNSSEDQEVVFRHLFSGCYRFKMKPLTDSCSKPYLLTDVKYIETNVLKRSIAEEIIDVASSSYSHKNILVVNIARNFSSEKTIIALADLHLHSPTEQSCQEFATDHSYCDMFNGMVICNSTNNVVLPECKKIRVNNILDSELEAEGKVFYKVSEKIKCTFFNVTPGNYCVKITVDDDRCLQHSVFKSESCTWRNVIEVKNSIPNSPAVNLKPVSAFSMSLMVIVTVILLFFIGVIIYVFKKKLPVSFNGDQPTDENIPMFRKKKVLLLYPRDCMQFMILMKSFGELLEKSHNIEVFDCYNNEDVLDGPLDWLQNKLSNPQFYILIVTTRCAYLHQEVVLAGNWSSNYSLYRDPTFLDRIFIYGLKWVMKDISGNPYSKNYVIGFRGFSRDEDMLSLPTSWRRYIIPDHLDRLLTDMEIYHSSAETLRNTVQHVKLENEIHSLHRHYVDNPYYLNEILAI